MVAVAVSGGAMAAASLGDSGVLNETQVQDAVGDSGGGADLSSVTVTTYADGTVSFLVQFANRDFLHADETVQIFVDVDDDGKADLNLSIWPNGDPSYLGRWNGTTWTDVRQLPELVESSGSFSVRLSLQELQGAAVAAVGQAIGVSVGSWTVDDATGTPHSSADDWLPSDQSWIQHRIAGPAATTTVTTTNPSAQSAPPILAVKCVRHALIATLVPGRGTTIASVSFFGNGKLKATNTKPPYHAVISTKAVGPLNVSAVVHLLAGGTQTLHKRARGCR
jgi:hypothetical protein